MSFQKFFSTEVTNQTSKLWQKPKCGTLEELIGQDPTTQRLPLAGKRSQIDQPIHDREFYLSKSLLFYSKNNQKLRGCIDLRFAYMRLEATNSSTGWEYCLLLEKESRFTRIYIKTAEAKATWEKVLTKFCIQFDFRQNFEALDKIGEGAFGSVYLVSRFSDEKRFAVKGFCKKNLLTKISSKAILVNEINTLRRLSSYEYFPDFEGVFESGNSIYLVMELIEGSPIFDLDDETSEFSIPFHDRIQVLQQLVDALLILKEQGIVHRDLKPDNLMYDSRTNSIKVIDFGLAVNHNEEVSKAGTPGFVAPEILKNHGHKCQYSTNSDLYSLGIIYYCLVSGYHPFDAEDATQILVKNKKGTVDYQSVNHLSIPSAELFALKGMLQNDPAHRISLTELSDQVQKLQIGPEMRKQPATKDLVRQTSNADTDISIY